MAEAKPPFLRRVQIDNFKSIRHCDVELQPLTLLVGPNGSGKTNFLDALRFVSESLKRPGDELFHLFRAGWSDFFRRNSRPATATEIDFGELAGPLIIELDLTMPSGGTACFSIELEPSTTFKIRTESCRITDPDSHRESSYRVHEGTVESPTILHAPPAPEDRPYLTMVSAFREFRPLYDSLRAMRFHAIQPNRDSAISMGDDDPLARDGENVRRVLWRILQDRPQVKQRVDDYLRAILPALSETRVESHGEMMARSIRSEYLERSDERRLPNTFYLYFLVRNGNKRILAFDADNMSDGTLHALGVLVALFQCRDLPAKSAIPLVAIEEPEANLHPGAAEVLMDAMTEATSFTQVMATTHSPDFLDYPDLDPESLLVFDASGGETVVAKADDASMAAIRDKLYTAGELLRLEQLKPRAAGARQ